MRDVPTELREASEAEQRSSRVVDALVILGRERGMSWTALGAALGVTKQGAIARHRAALRRQG